MILTTYQDSDGTVRILREYNDEQYDLARQGAEKCFTDGGRVVWMELLLTEMDGDLSTSVCLHRWVPERPHSLPEHPKQSPDPLLIRRFRTLALWLAGGMILFVVCAVLRAVIH